MPTPHSLALGGLSVLLVLLLDRGYFGGQRRSVGRRLRWYLVQRERGNAGSIKKGIDDRPSRDACAKGAPSFSHPTRPNIKHDTATEA